MKSSGVSDIKLVGLVAGGTRARDAQNTARHLALSLICARN